MVMVMKYKVNVAISNRHIHLTEKTYNMLFDTPITVKKELNQIGQFAANETVTILNGENVMEGVRIVGPFRAYNQVEISQTDARKLKLNPPVRSSGDLKGSETITVKTDKATIELTEACIIADRHVHFNTNEADKYNVKTGDLVKLYIDGDKSGVIDAHAKVSDDGFYEVHIDTDDASAFRLNTGDEIEVEILK